MRILKIRSYQFRNLASVDLDLTGDAHFFLGANGQGKTNLLEAVGMLTALRSFRTQDMAALVGWKTQGGAHLHFTVDHPRMGETEVDIAIEGRSRTVKVDGNPVAKLADFIGSFATVALSSQDIQMLRGSPQLRRRFLDLAVASVDPFYYNALRSYHQALRERNALLKQRAAPALFRPFEQLLVQAAESLQQLRKSSLAYLDRHFQEAYRVISPEEEAPELVYRPSGQWQTAAEFQAILDVNRDRDRTRETTGIGPHRDDFALRLLDHRAREYASEGQQRGMVLALRLAQMHWIREKTGLSPVILADDILGELDPQRQQGFWRSVGNGQQLLATGTRPPTGPEGCAWQIWRVEKGKIVKGVGA